MVDGLQTEFHGGLQKIFRLDRYFWDSRRDVKRKDWHSLRDNLESLWLELQSWMTEKEKKRFMPAWSLMQEEYDKLCKGDRGNGFRAEATVVQIILRDVSKAHNLDMKEYKPFQEGGAIWQGQG